MVPLKLSLAFGNSVVFIHRSNIFELVHMNFEGRVLWIYRAGEKITDEFVMLSDREVVLEEVKLNRILILNLETHLQKSISHLFLKEGPLSIKMFSFCKSELFAIAESASSQRIKYYDLR
jgi:hypothetical protein